MSSHLVNIILEDPRWSFLVEQLDVDLETWVHLICSATLGYVGFQPSVEFCVLLTDDSELLRLNAQFRNKDQSTDVLSFPMSEKSELQLKWSCGKERVILGDMALSFDTICQDSQKKDGEEIFCASFKDHTCHLVVHSLLHLLGFDHMEEVESIEMEGIEVGVLATLGVSNPYL